MIELKASLDGKGTHTKLDPSMGYMVDFSRLQSVNDLMVVISAMGISFPGNHPLIEHLKPFLSLDNPFPLTTEKPNLEDRIFNKEK